MSAKFQIIAKYSKTYNAFRPKHRKLTERLMNGKNEMVLIEVKPYREKRSIEQNAFYWGVIMPIVLDFHQESVGEKISPEKMHYYICTYVVGMEPEVIEVFGKQVIEAKRLRTSKMSKNDFSRFIEKVRDFFQERGCDFSQVDDYEKDH